MSAVLRTYTTYTDETGDHHRMTSDTATQRMVCTLTYPADGGDPLLLRRIQDSVTGENSRTLRHCGWVFSRATITAWRKAAEADETALLGATTTEEA